MFDNILDDIEGVFASTAWTTNNIPTFPDNYQGDIGSSEYIRISLLPSSSEHSNYSREKKISGLLAIKIFVKAGEGQGRLMEISDLLDAVLQSKQLTNGTRLGTSYLQVEGLDASNQALYSASYFITFSIFGE